MNIIKNEYGTLDELFEIDINGKQLEECNTVEIGIFELSSSEL